MSDDLIKRLREIRWRADLMHEAADRIEQLVATCEQLEREREVDHANINLKADFIDHMLDQLAEAEAKLFKAMEVLREIYNDGDATGCNPQWMVNAAGKVLAELEGNK